MNRSRYTFGLVLVLGSLALHVTTVILYRNQPDAFAAFTILPIWVWGAVGLMLSTAAYLLLRAPLALTLSGVWFLSILLLADEGIPLGRLGHQPPDPGPPARHLGRSPIRVATINWSGKNSSLVDPILPWQPDIVFIQEMPHPYRVKNLADKLHGNLGDYRYDENHSCGTVVRGRIEKALLNPLHRSQYLTLRRPDGQRIELVNLHLQPSSTNLSLWDPACWREHSANRKSRRSELYFALGFLKEYTPFPNRPAILGGDFNAPANDSATRVLREQFTDTFRAVGTGWGNTYHRRLPILRLDQIHVSHHFLPLRSRAIKIDESDHLLLVSDILLE